MATKSKTSQKKSRVKVGKLKSSKQSIMELTPSQKKSLKGGMKSKKGSTSTTPPPK
jgi:hypothetical protein